MNPGFGGDLRRKIFEAISNQTLDGIEIEIKDQLALLFPTRSSPPDRDWETKEKN